METITFLRQDLKEAHELLEAIMADVTSEAAQWIPPGRANPVGATYAHVVLSEDRTINAMMRHQKPLYDSTWMGKLGLSQPMPIPGPDGQNYVDWTREVQLDLPAFRQYAQAVYASTDEYLATLTSEDLDRQLDLSGTGMSQGTLGWVLSRLVVAHADNIAGEISCLKGLQGLQGYPF
jgi:DinB superfamily